MPTPIQWIVTPWLLRDESGRLRLAPIYRPEESDSEENEVIRWGKPSPSDYVAASVTSNGFSQREDNGKDENPPKKGPRLYKETSRDTVTKRVSNPQDANQYVDVEVITSISFQGPDGEGSIKFQLNNE